MIDLATSQHLSLYAIWTLSYKCEQLEREIDRLNELLKNKENYKDYLKKEDELEKIARGEKRDGKK